MSIKKSTTTTTASMTAVYCGPTIPGIAKQFAIYTDGIPDVLAIKAESVPMINNLIIPLNEFPEARRQLNTGSGLIYSMHKQVQKIIKGGK